MITKQQLERLRELVNVVIPAIPEEKIDLSIFWCGTTGCVLGHAMWHPPFIEQGFKIKQGYSPSYESALGASGTLMIRSVNIWRYSPSYESALGARAGQLFFGLTSEESDEVFHESGYIAEFGTENPTKDMIMIKLRRILDKHEKDEEEKIREAKTASRGSPTNN